MIVNYTLQKSKQMQQECKTIPDCIQFIEDISISEIQNNCSQIQKSFVMPFLLSREALYEEQLLLLYFCAKIVTRRPEINEILFFGYVHYLFQPFCSGNDLAVENFTISTLGAYLSYKICEKTTSLNGPFSPQEIQYCSYFLQANLIPHLTYLSASEQRMRQVCCYEKAYQVSTSLPSDIRMLAAHNYANILFHAYFANTSHVDHPKKAQKLFEQAIEYRTKDNPTAKELMQEVLSRDTYSANLRQIGELDRAKKIMAGLLEKIEKFQNLYCPLDLFYKDYLECLNNTLNLHEERKLRGLSHNVEYYLEKAKIFIKKIAEQKAFVQCSSLALFICNMLARDIIAKEHIKPLFSQTIPNEFWIARKLAAKEQDSKLENPEILSYGIFFQIADKIHEFWEKESLNLEILRELLPMVNYYFQNFADILHFDSYELMLIGSYGLSLFKSKDYKEGVYYCTYFLCFFPIVKSPHKTLPSLYGRILSELAKVFKEHKKDNEFANTLYCIQKFPWYAQQFRTIKSPELYLLLEKCLEIEISCNEADDGDLVNNVLSVWDNLTVNMGIISKRMSNFYRLPHPIHNWQLLVNLISNFEKIRRELGGQSEYEQIESQFRENWKKLFNTPQMYSFYGKEFISDVFNDNTNVAFLYQKELEYFEKVMRDEQINENKDFAYFIDSPFAHLGEISIAEFLKHILQGKRVICFSTLVTDFKPSASMIGKTSVKLLSTVVYQKKDKLVAVNQITDLSQEQLAELYKTTWDLEFVEERNAFVEHFSSLFNNISNKEEKSLLWIGVNLLKFFPIHILPDNGNLTWLDIWNTIEFCTSLREIYLPIKEGVYNVDISPTKEIVPIVRFIGEKESTRITPFLGNAVFRELANLENISLSTTEPLENGHKELGCMSEVFSYYGHICYGHPLNPEVGFLTQGKLSNLNHMAIQTSELLATKRLELWGCESAKISPYYSEELTGYEHFSERFLQIGIEQVIATLNAIPDITAALICEHFSLLEKITTNKDISLLLKNSIQWYRKSMETIRKKIHSVFSEWLHTHQKLPPQQIDKNQHPFLKSILTKAINDERSKFYHSIKIPFAPFTEKEVDHSFLRDGELCYLGRNKIKDLRIDNPQQYSNELIDQIFSPLESSSAWGSTIFINTSIR